nr:Rha family transcriptional regulator [Methylocystis echinoides]
MTRDGFTLLAMGFTGEAALRWKLKYIDAFNRMEAELRGSTKPALDRRMFPTMTA